MTIASATSPTRRVFLGGRLVSVVTSGRKSDVYHVSDLGLAVPAIPAPTYARASHERVLLRIQQL